MEPYLLPKENEESLEQRLDRINNALQSTMQEIEISAYHPKDPSMISYLHSISGSICNFEWLDQDIERSAYVKLPEGIEENLEVILQQLDRTQMINEDFWAENIRNQGKIKPLNDDIENYILKLEKENRELRSGGNGRENMKKNYKLEQERRNFEDKLAELDCLTITYRKKHEQIVKLEEELRIKEKLLEQKENDLKNEKAGLDKAKKVWEESLIKTTGKNIPLSNRKVPKKFILNDLNNEESQIAVLTPNRVKDMAELQAKLKEHEGRFKEITNFDDKSKEITTIDQIKNKIATLRGEEAMLNCSRSSRIMKQMKRTMEKEVNHEENLRKMTLEKYSVKGTVKMCVTPTHGMMSKKILFGEN
ncbi:hypothetical protein SteCoe_17266 [Stentor coeruleus]|uniref:Uncharacterized protein n=1 Tax=Stentor coeruleus TaxID=5963 RepID=A0A1R2BZ75_9CILI|nr:hypothetical protein SteCoe_17266 [Stentor coeruleus]